ncbi:hypothetical protein [Brachybacterium sp. YJGR34]|uniref:hypothetical protein n=1 Tax=Brachybacterium sp. YJGR34 TaxID=2059911 RepID=UPI00130080D7|nr:hypothetical protein [Brachybacterium sp. YJGR34]
MPSDPDRGAPRGPATPGEPRADPPAAPWSGRLPRLDAAGMPFAPHHADDVAAPPLPLPPRRWPLLAAGAGLVLTTAELLRVVPQLADEGPPPSLGLLFLAAALALGGFSAVRLLQLHRLAASHAARCRADPEADRRPVPWTLADAHEVHGVWLLGVGVSLALVGALGLWSLADGRRTGLEPGWPLLLIGGGVAAAAHTARARITARWRESGQGPREVPT